MSYGIKVELIPEGTGNAWLTPDGTSRGKAKAMKFDSQVGAQMHCDILQRQNTHAKLFVAKMRTYKKRK